MSSMMSQQPPKEDEEEDDEEQGEEFTFDDSTDEEKLQDGKGIDGVKADQVPTKEGSRTSPTGGSTQLPQTTPPAGPEGIVTKEEEASAPAGEDALNR